MIRVLVLVMLAPAIAGADRTLRVLLVDSDPELERAIKTTLAPWRIEIVVDTSRPVDTTHAQIIGDSKTARFVVWRERGELVVYDRDRGAAEHRAAPAGALDAASAAAAALTVKTLMRLPPPSDLTTSPAEPMSLDAAPTTENAGVEVRVQGGLASRMARGDYATRARLAVFARPGHLPLRFGVEGELGTSTDVQGAGFKGTWNDFALRALASWTVSLTPRWEIEPHVGAGALRSVLEGTERMEMRRERAILAALRAGVFVRARVGALSVGGAITVDGTLGTPTYTRIGNGTDVFVVPPFALSAGAFVAVDLGG